MATRTVEQSREIDVNWCNDNELLEPGQSGVLTWTRDRDGEEVASVGYTYRGGPAEALVLFYTITPNRGNDGPRDVRYSVPIEYTECNFGGERPWFRCPVCDDRVAKLYKTPRRDEYACRECGDLLYKSQTYQRPLFQAFDQLDDAEQRVQEGDFTREALRELYDAKQGVSSAVNAHIDHLDEKHGGLGRTSIHRQMNRLPPFEEWADDLFHQSFGSPGGRDYGIHGRCTATAKSTDERCRQPATGEHGKCYYHGGAPGSGVGEDQVDRQAEAFREEIERLLSERSERMADLDDLLDSVSE